MISLVASEIIGDLNFLDYYLWRYVKDAVYQEAHETRHDG